MTAEKYELRKYGNRRIYDPATSNYITLQQVSTLIREGHDIQVIDHRSGEDLTHLTLLQVVMEFEQNNPLLSTKMLRQMILSYGNQMHTTFSDFLGQSIQTFINQQTQLQDTLCQAMARGVSQADWVSDTAQSWYQLWQKSWFSVLSGTQVNSDEPSDNSK